MTIDGAVIREQSVSFAIVIVKEHVLNSNTSAGEAAVSFGRFFPGLPIILMAQNYRGVPTYWGRKDIVRFLANISMNRIPWQRYTIN